MDFVDFVNKQIVPRSDCADSIRMVTHARVSRLGEALLSNFQSVASLTQ